MHDLFRRLAEWRQHRRDIHRLHYLDDRLLADLGIDRAGIPAAVRGLARRPRSTSLRTDAASGFAPASMRLNPQRFRLPAVPS